jgi:hypothetical protein
MHRLVRAHDGGNARSRSSFSRRPAERRYDRGNDVALVACGIAGDDSDATVAVMPVADCSRCSPGVNAGQGGIRILVLVRRREAMGGYRIRTLVHARARPRSRVCASVLAIVGVPRARTLQPR